jgi:superfamily I DNA/RNA helicase
MVRALSPKDLIDTLFPDGVEETNSLREAALLAMRDDPDIENLFKALKTSITQPETPQEGDFVRVMSLHKSKGLKSRVVIVAGCVQGLTPFADSDESPAEADATLREQRRLFYVAITRSEEVLVLSSFARIDRALAYRIRLPTRGRGSIASTISSQFFDELGPAAPNTRDGNNWRDAGFI